MWLTYNEGWHSLGLELALQICRRRQVRGNQLVALTLTVTLTITLTILANHQDYHGLARKHLPSSGFIFFFFCSDLLFFPCCIQLQEKVFSYIFLWLLIGLGGKSNISHSINTQRSMCYGYCLYMLLLRIISLTAQLYQVFVTAMYFPLQQCGANSCCEPTSCVLKSGKACDSMSPSATCCKDCQVRFTFSNIT